MKKSRLDGLFINMNEQTERRKGICKSDTESPSNYCPDCMTYTGGGRCQGCEDLAQQEHDGIFDKLNNVEGRE